MMIPLGSSCPSPQPISLLMIVVGPKFIKVNGDHVPIGAWIIVLLTLLGAILTGKSYHILYTGHDCIKNDVCFVCSVHSS